MNQTGCERFAGRKRTAQPGWVAQSRRKDTYLEKIVSESQACANGRQSTTTVYTPIVIFVGVVSLVTKGVEGGKIEGGYQSDA